MPRPKKPNIPRRNNPKLDQLTLEFHLFVQRYEERDDEFRKQVRQDLLTQATIFRSLTDPINERIKALAEKVDSTRNWMRTIATSVAGGLVLFIWKTVLEDTVFK